MYDHRPASALPSGAPVTAGISSPISGILNRPLASRNVDGRPERAISLALQGGGAFGAFTWGFLDRLLEEDDIVIDVVSGASAGACNAVVLASGLAAGGREEARARLDHFWHQVGHSGPHLPSGSSLLVGGAAAALEVTTHLASPYQFNPLGLNPLRGILDENVQFDRLREESPVRLLIAATRVRDGHLRIFHEDEVTADVVLASACLPLLHHAVEIEGEAYWDGGYSANPPLRQLVIDTEAEDVILVQLLPEDHEGVPHSTRGISRRLQEISFTTSLQKEMEAVEDLRSICLASDNHSALCEKLQTLRIHRVSTDEFVPDILHASALDTRWSSLQALKADGRRGAESWLLANPGAGSHAETIRAV